MRNHLAFGLIALSALLPLSFVAGQAQAQSAAYAAAAPRIDGFDVEPVRQPTPGNELMFTLYGSPGGVATVKINGTTGDLPLAETEAGVYEGTYTIRTRDRILAGSAATANLRVGNRVASAILDEPLITQSAAAQQETRAPSSTAPKIEWIDADAPARLVAGEELILTMAGTPGGTASATIAGVKGKLVLNEIRTGVYEGRYVIKNRDRIAGNAAVTATLRVGNQQSSALLGRTLQNSAAQRTANRQAARSCVNCGVVEAINVVEVKGDGSYLGAIGGGLAGVLLGSQIGQGQGTTVAQVAGAVGGAYAGNEIEKRMKTTKHYEVVVRLENGGSQTFSYATQPAFAVGTKVKVDNNVLTVTS